MRVCRNNGFHTLFIDNQAHLRLEPWVDIIEKAIDQCALLEGFVLHTIIRDDLQLGLGQYVIRRKPRTCGVDTLA